MLAMVVANKLLLAKHACVTDHCERYKKQAGTTFIAAGRHCYHDYSLSVLTLCFPSLPEQVIHRNA